jgi:hypothetical protein
MSANVIAILALMVSIGAALLAWSVSHRQGRLQARMLELEEARERDRLAEGTRAAVTLRMDRERTTGRLCVLNNGPAAARNIRVTLDGKPIHQNALIHEGQEVIDVLGPEAHAEFVVVTWDGMPISFRGEVTWDNPGGNPGAWQSRLSFLI